MIILKGFHRLKSWHYFSGKHYIVSDGVMTLRASNQVLCNVWSYDFYEMTLATELQRRHMTKSCLIIIILNVSVKWPSFATIGVSSDTQFSPTFHLVAVSFLFLDIYRIPCSGWCAREHKYRKHVRIQCMEGICPGRPQLQRKSAQSPGLEPCKPDPRD